MRLAALAIAIVAALAGSRTRPTGIVSADARLQPGAHTTILRVRVRGLGHWVAEPPAAVLAERWQIAPFAAAQVQVSTASVAGRTDGGQCSASVLVASGPDQGPTITG
jgi:hypothetical protein